MTTRTTCLKLFRLLPVFLSALILMLGSVTVLPVAAATEEQDVKSRLIHVVYDDSNSMIAMVPTHVSTAWSEAKYSLMILHAMMQENDVMNVYFMSDFSPEYDGGNENENAGPLLKDLSGADNRKKQNIDNILNATTYTGGTFFSSIRKAYNDLKTNSDSYDERHLIVLTDGEGFYANEGSSDLNALFHPAADDGIHITYLAIGQNAIRPTADNDAVKVLGAVSDNVESENSILNCVEEAARHIFQREPQALDNGRLTVSYPVSEIVVFAQGKNVSVGNIGGTSKSSFSAALTQDDKDKATAYPDLSNTQIGGPENVLIAEGLSGEVAVFKPASGSYIPEGTYDLDVTATTYTVYCKPCLDVQLKITDTAGNVVADGDEITAGLYNTDYFLTYPEGHEKHGQPVTDLGFDVRYTLTVNTDGKQTASIDGDAPQSVDLSDGKTVVTVTARYLTYVSTDASINFTVSKNAGLKVIITDIQPDPIYSGSFNKSQPTARVTVTWCGQPLSEEQYNLLSLTAEMDNPIAVADGGSLINITDVTLDPYAVGSPTTGTVSFSASGSHELQRTKLPGNDDFTVTATLGQGEQALSATVNGSLGVERTWTLLEILLIALGIFAVLFVLFGYVFCKTYLPTKIHYNYDSNQSDIIRPYRQFSTWLSVLVPFMNVTANITVSYTRIIGRRDRISATTGLKIRAKNKSAAVLVDALDLYDSHIYIDVHQADLDMYKEMVQQGHKAKVPTCLLYYDFTSLYENGRPIVTFGSFEA